MKTRQFPLIQLLTYLAIAPLVVFILMTTGLAALLLLSARPAHPPTTVHIRRLPPLPAHTGPGPAEIRLVAPADQPEATVPELDNSSGSGVGVPGAAPATPAATPGSAFFEALLQEVKLADSPPDTALENSNIR